MVLLYDLIFLLYALVYLPYLLFTGRGYAGFGIRFGFFPSQVKKQIKAKANIWVHAVSVGEVMVLDGFKMARVNDLDETEASAAIEDLYRQPYF